MKSIDPIVKAFCQYPEVEAIVLGGSRASNMADHDSDIDLYVYVNQRVDPMIRQNVLTQYCQYMEIANQYWEEEDDVILHDGMTLEIIYRDLKSFVHGLNRVAYEHIPSNAYTTCGWYSLIHSEVLFDRHKTYTAIQKRYHLTYPERLAKRIIDHGMPLLTGSIPSFDQQIIKALKRHDIISVNHRITEFLATYFDILFAVNHMLHPGEKRMVEHLLKANYLPNDFEQLLDSLIHQQHDYISTETTLKEIITHLTELLNALNYR